MKQRSLLFFLDNNASEKRPPKRVRDEEKTFGELCSKRGESGNCLINRIISSQFFNLRTSERAKRHWGSLGQRSEVVNFMNSPKLEQHLKWSYFYNSNEAIHQRTESLLASNIYRNSVIDLISDTSGQLVSVLQRTALSLLSTKFHDNDLEYPIAQSLLVRLDSVKIQERNRLYQRHLFGFSCSHFIGNSLYTACGFNLEPILEIFDLEDVDEDVCEPVSQFHLTKIHRSYALDTFSSEERAPFVTDVFSISNQVAMAGLSNGESAWVDLRQKIPIQCTPHIGAYCRTHDLSEICRIQRGCSPISSMTLCTSNGEMLVLGTKDGTVSLWDLRNPKGYIAFYRSNSEIGRLWPYSGAKNRIGCSEVWFNNLRGNIVGLTIGSNTLSESCCIQTEDFMRDDALHNIPLQKLVVSKEGFAFYPHISLNRLMAFDMELDFTRIFSEKRQRDFLSAAQLMDVTASRNRLTSSSEVFLQRRNELNQRYSLAASVNFSAADGQICACSIFEGRSFILTASTMGGLCCIHKEHDE